MDAVIAGWGYSDVLGEWLKKHSNLSYFDIGEFKRIIKNSNVTSRQGIRCTLLTILSTCTTDIYIWNNRLSKYLPYLTSIMKGTRHLQSLPKLSRSAWSPWSSVQHSEFSEYTGSSHTTRHASRPWQLSCSRHSG